MKKVEVTESCEFETYYTYRIPDDVYDRLGEKYGTRIDQMDGETLSELVRYDDEIEDYLEDEHQGLDDIASLNAWVEVADLETKEEAA
jgi:hypothetical protein